MIKVQWGEKSILFTGDLGRAEDPILNPPQDRPESDYLVVESTYGNRAHDPTDPKDQLESLILDAVQKGSILIVPAFAVGRTQNLLYYLWQLKSSKRIPDLPIYIDSPMATDVTQIYLDHSSDHKLNPQQCQFMKSVARFTRTPEESKGIDQQKGPMIIISASGMATGGRVLHHLKRFMGDPKNMILLSGYQAPGTRGESLLNGAPSLKIHGQYFEVKAKVQQIQNLSAHADQDELIQWLQTGRKAPRHTFINHGEVIPAECLRRRIQDELKWTKVSAAETGEELDL